MKNYHHSSLVKPNGREGPGRADALFEREVRMGEGRSDAVPAQYLGGDAVPAALLGRGPGGSGLVYKIIETRHL